MPAGHNPLAERVKSIAASPLLFHPGTQWNYGSSTDVLGYLIEVVSGKSLDDFLRERLFVPLGMRDTHFRVPKDKVSRLAGTYQKRSGQNLQKSAASNVTEPAYFSASGGLVSSPADYVRFGAMLANNGELDGKKYLSRKTLEMMTAPSWGHLDSVPARAVFRARCRGQGRVDEVRSTRLARHVWVERRPEHVFQGHPKEQLVLLMFVQITPGNNVDLQGRISESGDAGDRRLKAAHGPAAVGDSGRSCAERQRILLRCTLQPGALHSLQSSPANVRFATASPSSCHFNQSISISVTARRSAR